MACFIPRFHLIFQNPLSQRLHRSQFLYRINSVIRNSQSHVFSHSSILFFTDPPLGRFARCFCSNIVQNKRLPQQELSFQHMLKFRQKQAHCTVLVELPSADTAPYVSKLCKEMGEVVKAISYSGQYGNNMLLVEFKTEEIAHHFLQHCCFKNAAGSFPTYSRFVRFEQRKITKRVAVSPEDEIEVASKPKCETRIYPCMVSHLIKNVFEEEKVSDLSTRLRFLFATSVQDSLSGMLPYCEVLPFGSSLNGFGSDGSDLDLVLQMFPEQQNSPKADFYFQTKNINDPRIIQKQTIICLYEIMKAFYPGIKYIQRVIHARVPIMKFKHNIVDFDCDISVNNLAAFYMTEILYFYGSLDARVRPLVYAVKKWAKETNITYSMPGSWITNFSLALLVMFFLQNRPMPILPALLKAADLKVSPETYSCCGLEYIENAEKWRTAALNNKETLGGLLHEFFVFLSTYPFAKSHISVLSGVALQRSNDHPIWVQYPLEEDQNVTKNVSISELNQLVRVARLTAKQLEESLRSNDATFVDFEQTLGIKKVKRSDQDMIDVANFYEGQTNDAKSKKQVRRV